MRALASSRSPAFTRTATASWRQRLFGEHKIPVITMPKDKTEEIFILDEARRTKAERRGVRYRTALPRVALEQMRRAGHVAS